MAVNDDDVMDDDSAVNENRLARFLLNGRRVRISDLIDAGLLKVGAVLVFQKPLRGREMEATVTEDDLLVLEDGPRHATPSGAGYAITGRATAGWAEWVVQDSRITLGGLRSRLLESIASDTTSAHDPIDGAELPDSPSLKERFAFLSEAHRSAEAGTPRRLTVSDLLAWWGTDRRGYRVRESVDADLANHDLVTVPNFREVGLNTWVELRAARSDAAEAEPLEGSASARAESASAEADQSQPEGTRLILPEADKEPSRGGQALGRTVGSVPSAERDVASVQKNATLEEAITRMLLDDYSQLAVMAGSRQLEGAVTWKSIATARHADKSATLMDAMADVNPTVPRYDQDLGDALQVLKDADFIFVRRADRRLGIVTAADVIALYEETAEPFSLIGDLDRTLRNLIADAFSLDEVNRWCRANREQLTTHEKLTFGDYQALFGNSECWDRLAWPIHRPTFVNRLADIREIRNDVAHFKTDPLRSGTIGMLRQMIRTVRMFAATSSGGG